MHDTMATDQLTNNFLNKYPASFWIFIGIVVGGALVYMFIMVRKSVRKSKKAMKEVKNLPCSLHSEKLNKIDAVDAKIDGIMQTLQLMSGLNKGKNIIQAQSPVNLTKYGKSLIDELKMSERIDENWNTISKCIEDNSKSMNPYDIQQFCFNYVITNTSEVIGSQGYDDVKKKAYTLGIPAINILQGVAILIRNKYFEEHQIDVKEVDEHDPDKNNND